MMRSRRRLRRPASRHDFLRHLFLREGARFAQAYDAGNVERSRAHAALMAAAVDDGRDLHARILASNVESADAFWPVKLVSGDRHYVDVLLVHVDRNLADGLNRVGVEDYPALATQLANFCDGLNTPISLLAAMIVTRMVLSSMARFRSSRSIRPSFWTGI